MNAIESSTRQDRAIINSIGLLFFWITERDLTAPAIEKRKKKENTQSFNFLNTAIGRLTRPMTQWRSIQFNSERGIDEERSTLGCCVFLFFGDFFHFRASILTRRRKRECQPTLAYNISSHKGRMKMSTMHILNQRCSIVAAHEKKKQQLQRSEWHCEISNLICFLAEWYSFFIHFSREHTAVVNNVIELRSLLRAGRRKRKRPKKSASEILARRLQLSHCWWWCNLHRWLPFHGSSLLLLKTNKGGKRRQQERRKKCSAEICDSWISFWQYEETACRELLTARTEKKTFHFHCWTWRKRTREFSNFQRHTQHISCSLQSKESFTEICNVHMVKCSHIESKFELVHATLGSMDLNKVVSWICWLSVGPRLEICIQKVHYRTWQLCISMTSRD